MDRRQFVHSVAGAGMASLVARWPLPAPAARRIERIGLQLYTVRDKMKEDFEGTLAQVAQIGYKEVEFAGYFGHAPADVKALLDKHGLSAPSTHIGDISPDGWKAALDTCKVIGHEYIVVPWIPAELRANLAAWKKVAADFNRLAAQAHDAGVQFAYHNHNFEFPKVDGQVPYDVLLENTDPKLVQLEIDLYWITKAGADPLTYFARWPGRIPLVHVKDATAAPERNFADVGQGTIDWKRIFAKEDQAGIKHFFVEHDQPPQPFQDIAASYNYLKNLEF
jgi:sugar phosphate isomerase/epimerase